MTALEQGGVVMKWGTILGMVAMLTGALITYFSDKAAARSYTDTKVSVLVERHDRVHFEQMKQTKKMQEHLYELSKDSAVMRQILEDQFVRR